jgi:hypothetical protein
MVLENIGSPAVVVRRTSQVLAQLDLGPGIGAIVSGTLHLAKSWQSRSRMCQVGKNVVDDFHWQGVEGASRA